MPPDKTITGSPMDWLARAKGSLVLAKQPKAEDAFWEDQCFLAQQAAEKAIKAVYQFKGLLFRYTHDLEELGKGLEDSGVPIPSAVKEATSRENCWGQWGVHISPLNGSKQRHRLHYLSKKRD